MGAAASPARPSPLVVHLSGELDARDDVELAAELENALARGVPVIVDVGDCTFADVDLARLLARYAQRATAAGSGFVLVLPYSARTLVRRLLLELVPDLDRVPIVPTRAMALTLLARAGSRASGSRAIAPGMRNIRQRAWENGSRLERLLAQRDVLVLERRRTVGRIEARRRGLL